MGRGRLGVALALSLSLVLTCDGELGGLARGRLGPPPGALRLRGAGTVKKKEKLTFKTPGVGPRCSTQSSLRLREMAKFPMDPAIAKAGCALLWKVCVNGEKQKRIGNFKGACKALIKVLQVHWKSEAVMQEALCLAVNLCFAQPNNPMGFRGWSHIKNQEEVGRMGGVRLIINTVKQHERSTKIVTLGTRALANLAFNNTLNAEMAVRWEGVETVLHTMRLHPGSMYVQEAGCIFLWSCLLAIKNETHITYGYEYTGASAGGTAEVDLRIAGKIASEGGVDDVMNALRMYGNNTSQEGNVISVAEQACAALWYMARVPGRLQDTVKSIPDIVPVLKDTIRANTKVSPCAATWAARMLELVTGRNCSKWMMPIKVPGPSVAEDRIKEVVEGVDVCQPGCGCEEDRFSSSSDVDSQIWGSSSEDETLPLRGAAGEAGKKKKKKKKDLEFSKLKQDLEFVKGQHEKKLAKKRGVRVAGGGVGDEQVVLEKGGEEEWSSIAEEGAGGGGVDSFGDDDDMVMGMNMAQAAEERKKYKATEGKRRKKVAQVKKARREYESKVHEDRGKSTYQLGKESYEIGVKPSAGYDSDEGLLPTPMM